MSDTYSTGLVDELDPEEKALFEGGETPPAEETPVETPPAEEKPAVAEPPADEKKEDAAAPAEDEDGEEVVELEGNKGRFIRHGAFHRERKLRQEREKALADMQRVVEQEKVERARINERLAILTQATQQPQQQKPVEGQQQVPNPEEDPFAYMRYLEGRLNQLGENTEQVGQRFQAQDEYSSARTAFMADAQRYAQETPDFMDAYTHLMQSRTRELENVGVSDPRERQRIIAQEELQIVKYALNTGRSPAELFYELSNVRGYRKAEPAPVAAPAPTVSPQGVPPAGSVPAVQPKSAVEQVKAVAAAQAASKSLSSAAGGGVPTLTAETLANMSEAEFEKVYAQMSREQRKAYFGG